MNRNSFYDLISNPTAFTDIQVKRLEEVVSEFQYFNPARILLLKAYHERGDFNYSNLLSLASLHSQNRKKLFELINSGESMAFAHNVYAGTVQNVDNEPESVVFDMEEDVINENEKAVSETVTEEFQHQKETDVPSIPDIESHIPEEKEAIEIAQVDAETFQESISLEEEIDAELKDALEKDDSVNVSVIDAASGIEIEVSEMDLNTGPDDVVKDLQVDPITTNTSGTFSEPVVTGLEAIIAQRLAEIQSASNLQNEALIETIEIIEPEPPFEEEAITQSEDENPVEIETDHFDSIETVVDATIEKPEKMKIEQEKGNEKTLEVLSEDNESSGSHSFSEWLKLRTENHGVEVKVETGVNIPVIPPVVSDF